jgi:hypothetical protein
MRTTTYAGSLARVVSVALVAAVPAIAAVAAQGPDYLEPRVLPCSMFPVGGGPLLFKSERRAFETNGAIYATCDYTYPNGELAAQDRIVYRAGQLVSFEEEQLQLREKGSAVIQPDPKHPGARRIFFQYTTGQGSVARTSTDSEALENDTLADDMLGPFIASHWSVLEKGMPARFRLLVLSRKETVGFKLVKESESSRKGVSVVRLRMEPTSIIIARLVDPLHFEVEKDPPHRVLEYRGRTTPLVRSGNKWKELDALCVYDWGHVVAQTKFGSAQVNTEPDR